MRRIRIVLAQLKPLVGDVEGNVRRVVEVLDQAHSVEAHLVVFPELFLTGYLSRDLLYRLAEPLSGPHVSKVSEACSELGVAVVVGFPELDEDYYVVYNSALLVDERGEVAVARKRHLPTFKVFDEHRYFRPWRGRLRLWRPWGVPTGVVICYDTFFPEVSRAYALMGAKLIASISASPDFSLRFFRILVRARAVENTVYYVWVNTVGTFDGLGFAGGSVVVGPLGDLIAECKLMDEEVKVVDLDMEAVRRAREVRPVVRDLHLQDFELLVEAYRSYML